MATNAFTLPNGPLKWISSPLDKSSDYNLGIYTADATQRFVYGTRFITWDGRVYKYCNAVAQVYSYWGAHAYEDESAGWAALPSANYAGERKQVVTLGSRTENDLAGGYIMINDNSATQTTYFYGIVGNNDTATVTTIYLDGALPVTTTTSDACEIFENPYRETKAHAAGICAVVAVPAMSAAAGYKYWGQTYGPAYISPTNATLDDPGVTEHTVYFSYEGTTGGLIEAAVGSSEAQHAGFILNADISSAGSMAGPLIMLQISI